MGGSVVGRLVDAGCDRVGRLPERRHGSIRPLRHVRCDHVPVPVKWQDREERELPDHGNRTPMPARTSPHRHVTTDRFGIDSSPGAVEVCRRRGVAGVTLASIEGLDDSFGLFDTVLLLGGGFGLLGTPEKARSVLDQLRRITSDRGRILAANRDYTAGSDPDRAAAARRNLDARRVSGQTRIRIRYRYHATPYFDYFRCSPNEMASIVDGTGWTLRRVLDAHAGQPYVGIIEKA